MITIFNRRLLLVTYDMKLQADVRTKLSDNNIDYVLNPVPFSLVMGGYYGGGLSAEYKFYVRKKDYDLAVAVINDRLKK
ncbi:MAG: hypothetical protein Q8882_04730 [Bacillota bacterium]|nr:hypothetical protein [Bacillota bacterium]